ncbi:MFS transporter [Streptomyces sp. NBC_00199]|uniref:MFS transporter n=1 Tax=Streptomyces sp. NBC_00199 TaxID=2975678 RepID=UPI002254C210|nr:MFS transporter [Streptomyces sp. NBC_00199]MCX5266786.1 MFS transporter [Streptomyces sp. NBC_00199]
MTATLYAYAFLDEFVLLYPVYALLFADAGLSVGEISSLFVLWSLTGVLLEVPSGAWADAVSRRLLLWTGPLLGAAGFALWVLFPSYWAFAAGFVLWGARGALGSGALEALVYEELDRAGAADRYARVMGRAHALGQVAVMAATGLAGPVFAAGGYPAVGAASVLACLLCAATAVCFPEHRTPASAGSHGGDEPAGGGAGGDRGTDGDGGEGDEDRARTPRTALSLLAGLRRDRPLLGALLLVPAVTAVWGALDEYTPLLVRETGAADAAVPYLLMTIWAGVTAGSLLAGAAERLGRTGLAAVLAGAALALAAGALTEAQAGIALVGLAFGGFQAATVLADVRLQQHIEGGARATLTSIAGLGTELVTVAVYGVYGVLGARFPHGVVFALCALPYLVTALAVGRRRKTASAPSRGRRSTRARRVTRGRGREG